MIRDTRGAGPLLLLIPGANGDANGFPPLADQLAADLISAERPSSHAIFA
jgi:hypothetical protein